MIVCILGRQPRLASAELEALYGAERVRVFADAPVALVDVESISRELGGAIKIARQLDTLPVTKFASVTQQLKRRLSGYISDLPSDGKIKFGVSVYGLDVSLPELNRASLFFKQTIKRASRSVRAVPNTELALGSAQVIHNQLTSPLGLELLLIRDGDRTIVARTLHEQDIEAYTLRDRGRPRRDAFVGMLPPKLAQIMIHLAEGARNKGQATSNMGNAPAGIPTSGLNEGPAALADTDSDVVAEGFAFPAKRGKTNNQLAPSESEATMSEDGIGSQASASPTLLDPFCGTGVILQEAILYGYHPYATDLSERMVRYTRDNLNWLMETHRVSVTPYYEVADATTHTWRQPIDLVVCEGYLGRPIGGQQPTPEQLHSIIAECDTIMRNFLTNIAPQLRPGTPLCIGAPAWFVQDATHHPPCLDDLEEMGYRRTTFVHADHDDLIYRREDQAVGRELLVLTKR